MIVTVKYFALIREITQTKEDTITLDKKTSVQMLLTNICGRYGLPFQERVCTHDGSLHEGLILLLNGKAIQRSIFKTCILRDGDTVAIMPPVGGGHGSKR
jgi:MoaD family protein